MELLSTNKSPESEKVEVPINTPQATQVPYRHPHHKKRDCEIRRQVMEVHHPKKIELGWIKLFFISEVVINT